MSSAQRIILLTATLSLAKKGHDIISAIKEKDNGRAKGELLLFTLILIIGVALFVSLKE